MTQTVIITGGSRGIGAATARLAATRGYWVCLSYLRHQEAADRVVADIRDGGGTALAVAADVAFESDVCALFEQAEQSLGPVNALVNNAGILETQMRVEHMSQERLHRVLSVNVIGAFLCAREAVKRMSTGHGGRGGAIVNVTDAKTATPYRKHFSYVVAKGALDTFTAAAAVGLAPRIRVNAVALGVILPPPDEDEAYAERLARRLPLQRVGGTEPVADAVLALLENDFVTGEILRVDGGGHLV